MSILYTKQPQVLNPELAEAVGLNASIVLQQLRYWLAKSRHIHDGQPWVYNTYEQWQEQFPWWSKRTIQTVILNLENDGLILTRSDLNAHASNRTKWYAINYDHPILRQRTDPDGHDEEVARDHRAGSASSSMDRDYTTTETTPPVGGHTPKRMPKTYMTDVWEPKDGTDNRAELERFRDHWLGKGEARADWNATWRNWLRNAPRFSGPVGGTGGAKPAKKSAFDIALERYGGGGDANVIDVKGSVQS